MKKRYLIDCDGVLSDFCGLWLSICNSMYDTHFTATDVKDFGFHSLPLDKSERDRVWDKMRTAHIKDMKPLYVGHLPENSFIVTSALSLHPTWHLERIAWLDEHYGIPEKRILFTASKHIVSGDVFVDDLDSNVISWCEENPKGEGILLETTYTGKLANPPPNLRVMHREEVYEYLKKATQDV